MRSAAMGRLLSICVSILTFSGVNAYAMTMASTLASTQPHLSKKLLTQTLNCNNAQTQLEINVCADLFYQNADKKLNQVYQKLLPKLPKSRQQKLIDAQLAWVKFRDASCEFERSGYEGGTIAPAIYSACLEKFTKQRTQQLRDYLQSNR
jgi:uncharacterized protein YecT (DUF1311 family)